jgi:DNA-binding NtrC family response regulator
VPQILVIEDNEPLLESTVRILSSAGYEVLGAGSGREGLRVWRELGADLVITDARMADIDGLQLILELRAIAPGLPVMMMSGDPGVRAHLEREVPGPGSVSFLAKPFRMAQLLAATVSALGGQAPEREAGRPRAGS